jgi:tetratricopeptide (TPR) repeat protein
MDSLGILIVVVAIVGTALQGGSGMFSKRRPLSVGFLDLGLCVVILSITTFLSSGALVIAPEFGAFMVQGEGAAWALRMTLVITGALPILCWYRIRQLNKSPVTLWPWLLAGMATGAWATSRLHSVNPNDLEPLRVRMYDVWWAPFVVWLVYCLAKIMLALAETETQRTDFALAAALTAPLARFALVHQELFDPQSRLMWRILEPASLLLAILLVAQPLTFLKLSKKRRNQAFAVLLAGEILAGILSVFANDLTKLILDLIIPVGLVGSILIAIYVKICKPEKNTKTGQPQESGHAERPASRTAIKLKRALSRFGGYRLSGILFAVSILIIPACLIDLLSLGVLNWDLEIAILTFFWLNFSARLAKGVLHRLPLIFKGGVVHLPAFKQGWQHATKAVQGVGVVTSNAVKQFTSGSGWLVTFRTAVLTVVALLGLVAVGEMLNYGKLVVEPFDWKGGGTDSAKVADRVSAGVVNTLGDMRRELLPVLMVGSPADKPGAGPKVQSAILDDGALQGAVAKGTDLKLANVDIPLPLLTSPIERLVQWAFSIREVHGSLHTTSDGKQYVVLIESDKGDTWKVLGDIPATGDNKTSKPAADANSHPADKNTPPQAAIAPPAATTPPAASVQVNDAASKSQDNNADSETHAARLQWALHTDPDPSPPDGLACGVDTARGVTDPLDEMIDEVAFRIASSDPSFIAMGLTRNWKAYGYFHNAVRRWNCYQAYKHWSDLEKSIILFRQAVMEDSTFAPADYRLGIAMQAAGEPDGAIHAFTESFAANPELIQARTAEAQTLSLYETVAYGEPAIADIHAEDDWMHEEVSREAHSREARRIWAAVVALKPTPANQLNILTAYYGLCSDRFESEDPNYSYRNKYYLTYFYCSRARALYYRLPPQGRSDVEQKKAVASILLSLGDALSYHDSRSKAVPVVQPKSGSNGASNTTSGSLWLCSADAFDFDDIYKNGYITTYQIPGSALMGHALRYYRESLAMVPDDDYALCAEATAAAYLAKTPDEEARAMQKLANSPAAHTYLASVLEYRARRFTRGRVVLPVGWDPKNHPFPYQRLASFYYLTALRELDYAIYLSPSDPDALNDYASTVWQWSLDGRSGKTDIPMEFYRSRAEGYAREAIRQNQLRNDYIDEVVARDTLGDALMTLGRNEEALWELDGVRSKKFNFYGYDELQWDFAQASICSATTAGSPEDAEEDIEAAEDSFTEIKTHELNREVRPFTMTPGALDPVVAKQRCFPSPDYPSATPDSLSFSGVTYQSQPGCKSFVMVEASIEGTPPANPGPALQIWGGGADALNFDRMYGPAALTAQLIPPLHGHRLYFAQIVDPTNSKHSPVVGFDVPDDKDDAACPHGVIVLHFKPIPAPSAQP